jgi:hypothetical protein
MLQRIRNLWHPEAFHYAHRLAHGGGQFEGWYYKVVDAEGRQPYAFIPGVFLGADAHAFIQVLDGRSGTSAYHRFAIESFRATPGELDVLIAGNRFTQLGIEVDIGEAETSAKQAVRVDLAFGPWRPWPVGPLSPGVMGPYSFVPFMQCNHGMSLHDKMHRLELDARRTDGATLHAPYDAQMIERVAETMTSEVAVRLSTLHDDKTIFEGVGRHGCLEVQGDLERVLDEGHVHHVSS